MVRLPPVPEMTPEKVVDVLSAPAVSAPDPRVMLPAPAMEPTVSVKLLRLYVALLATVTAVLLDSTLMAPALKVPALMAVAPV